MAMNLLSEAPELQHMTHPEAITPPPKAPIEKQAIVNQDSEPCLSVEIKKKGRTKRNVAHGEAQVAIAFNFMRKRRQDLTLGAKVKVGIFSISVIIGK
ncbi:hypothetical protein Hamer_G002326 [Homarus americanus]|uniref:Uncharacterized protein n=1 Tax=Homarus americanus TaxID=6706 RepID=A0A8J5MYX0_HOMAM|nr:hypothetical protein Hamer_G002326 [Homarus americanus]